MDLYGHLDNEQRSFVDFYVRLTNGYVKEPVRGEAEKALCFWVKANRLVSPFDYWKVYFWDALERSGRIEVYGDFTDTDIGRVSSKTAPNDWGMVHTVRSSLLGEYERLKLWEPFYQVLGQYIDEISRHVDTSDDAKSLENWSKSLAKRLCGPGTKEEWYQFVFFLVVLWQEYKRYDRPRFASILRYDILYLEQMICDAFDVLEEQIESSYTGPLFRMGPYMVSPIQQINDGEASEWIRLTHISLGAILSEANKCLGDQEKLSDPDVEELCAYLRKKDIFSLLKALSNWLTEKDTFTLEAYDHFDDQIGQARNLAVGLEGFVTAIMDDMSSHTPAGSGDRWSLIPKLKWVYLKTGTPVAWWSRFKESYDKRSREINATPSWYGKTKLIALIPLTERDPMVVSLLVFCLARNLVSHDARAAAMHPDFSSASNFHMMIALLCIWSFAKRKFTQT